MSARARYFEVSFQPRDGDQFPVRVETVDGGSLSDRWTCPIHLGPIADPLDLDAGECDPPTRDLSSSASSLPDVSLSVLSQEDESRAGEGIGDLLFESLMTPEIRQLYQQDIGRYGDELALLLTFDLADPDHRLLYGLPWEELRDHGQSLELCHRRPVVRRLWNPRAHAPAPLNIRRLRILAVPLDDELLDLGAESAALETLQREGASFDLEIVEPSPTVVQLRRRLELKKIHVLHLMGHGRWCPSRKAWGVDLGGEFVPASKLSRQLAGHLRHLRLIVLNTCHSGRAQSPDGSSTGDSAEPEYLGLAPSLLGDGAVSVIANRAAISDKAARCLTRGLYDRIGFGRHVAHALTAARLDIDGQEYGILEKDWATPIHLVAAKVSEPLFKVVRRSPIEIRAWIVLVVLLLGLAGVLLNLYPYVAHPPWLARVAGSAAAGMAVAGRVLWAWLGSRSGEPSLSACLRLLERSPRFTIPLASGVVVGSVLLWTLLARHRAHDLPCFEIVDQAPNRLIGYSFGSKLMEKDPAGDWRNGLLGRWLESGQIPVSVDSSKGGALADADCLAWRVDVEVIEEAGGTSSVAHLQPRGSAAARSKLQIPGPFEASRERLRAQVLARLDMEASWVDTGTQSVSRAKQMEAVLAYSAGDLGKARSILEQALAQDADSPELQQTLAAVLFDSARVAMLEVERAPLKEPPSSEKVTELLLAAEQRLRNALDIGPSGPEACFAAFDLSRVYRLLGEWLGGRNGRGDEAIWIRYMGRSKSALETALELRPTYAEALNDLAVLEMDLDDRRAEESLKLLLRAADWVETSDDLTRATILKNQGRALTRLRDFSGAWQALDRAECLAPVGENALRVEILGLAAETLTEHPGLGPGVAGVAWRRYGELLIYDEAGDDRRRRQFFDHQFRFPTRGWTSVQSNIWSRRCDLVGR